MSKYKSEYYKISAVNYYLDNNVSIDYIYNNDKSIKQYNRKPKPYKITKQNEEITMLELSKQINKKYKYFNVTQQWLDKVLKDHNKTRKITRHEHFPTKKYNKHVNKKQN